MTKKKNIKKVKNTGTSLEQAVARIQQLMDPGTVVEHNVTLADRLGINSQFDVVIRGSMGGREQIGVIECKDHTVKIGPALVRSFIHKVRDINAGMALMVSKKGFTRQALTIAKHEGVGTLSLLPNDPADAGFSIGVRWYGRVFT